MFALSELQETAPFQAQGQKWEGIMTPTHPAHQHIIFVASLQRPAGKVLACYCVTEKYQQRLILLVAVNFLIFYHMFSLFDMFSSPDSYRWTSCKV